MAAFFRFLVYFASVVSFAVSSESTQCGNCSKPKCDLVIGNTNTACRLDSIGLTRFLGQSKTLQICDGKRWLQLPLEGTEGSYGGRHNPGLSCSDIYNKARQSLPNGVYWIKMSGQETSFPVYCDMLSGGWTMVFKAVSGVPSLAGNLWLNPMTSYEDTLKALDVSNRFKKHYKNRIVKHWTAFNPSEARVVLYKNEDDVVQLKFNAKGTTNSNWYSINRLVDSPWTDISTAGQNAFSISGRYRPNRYRSFMIYRNHYACHTDAGWFAITGSSTCTWEQQAGFGTIIYSNTGTSGKWITRGSYNVADVMAVYVR